MGGRRRRGGCSSPFMNSQAPISSPDSAAILSERRSREGWVVARGAQPPPGAAPVPGSRGAGSPQHQARPRGAAGAEGGGGSGVSAPGAPGTFRGEPEPAPRGAHTPRAVAAPIGTRLPPPPLRRHRRARDTQRRSHGRAECPPGARGDHGGAAGRPRSRPWLLARQRAGLRCPGPAAAALAAPAPPPFRGNSPRLLPSPRARPQTARRRPSAVRAPRPPLKGTAGSAPSPGAPRVTWSPLLRLCCRPPIAGGERGRGGLRPCGL